MDLQFKVKLSIAYLERYIYKLLRARILGAKCDGISH